MIARYHHYIVTAATGLGEKFTSAAAEQLHEALCRNKMDVAKALLETGVRPDEDTLLTAIWKNKADWVKLFMDHGVKPTPLSLTYTRHYRNPEIRDILLGAGMVPDEQEMNKAVDERLAETVKAYIAHGAKPTAEMLDVAARKNWDIETAKALLEAGVVPEPKTLEFVVGYKRDNFAKRFFADSRKPKTPKSDWIKVLAAAGVVPTPDMLSTAVRHKDKETAKTLIAAGAVPSDRLLCTTLRDGTRGWFEMLVEARGTPPASLLWTAVARRQSGTVSYLVNKGAVPDEAVIKLAADRRDTHSRVLLEWAFNEHKAKQAKQPRKKLVLSKPAALSPKLVHRPQG